MARFKRILLKLSGESLMGEKQYGIDEKRLNEYAQQIKEIHELGVQIGIVIGGGNIFRGLSGASKGFDRVKGDQMGMLATVINSLGLSSALGAAGVKARVLTAIRMEPIGEFYSKWKAIEAMENGEVVIMSAGTGNPFFTTDTGSSLRGIEIEADVMLKGTLRQESLSMPVALTLIIRVIMKSSQLVTMVIKVTSLVMHNRHYRGIFVLVCMAVEALLIFHYKERVHLILTMDLA